MIVLESDKDTLFVTLTSRQLNRDLRIVVKAVEARSKDKFLKAGADSVVSSNFIGGMRIASEMIRPAVVSFLDEMLRDPQSSTRFEELDIKPGSKVAGKTIHEAGLFERAGVLVIAYRTIGSDRFVYNPPASTVLARDSVMVVLGDSETMPKVRALIG
jgi:voltage-gated potassium channel